MSDSNSNLRVVYKAQPGAAWRIVEFLEEEVVTTATTETLQVIHHLRTETVLLRRSVWPLREVIGGLERTESPLIKDSTGIYLSLFFAPYKPNRKQGSTGKTT